MVMERMMLIGMLMVSPLLNAQGAGTHAAVAQQAETGAQPTHAQHEVHAKKGLEADADPLQITISFAKQRHGKVTIERTYTVTATTDMADPQIRDDTRVPYQSLGNKQAGTATTATAEKADSGARGETQYVNYNTDVDIQNVRMWKGLVELTLRISIDGTADDVTVPPILRSHRYVISPTLPIGKQATVYSEDDVLHETKVEIQVLIEPLKVQ
ncbi:MAG: hypothetical protein ABSF28_12670 [Terracidiphilus sp.]|jgi:hypothetical protein